MHTLWITLYIDYTDPVTRGNHFLAPKECATLTPLSLEIPGLSYDGATEGCSLVGASTRCQPTTQFHLTSAQSSPAEERSKRKALGKTLQVCKFALISHLRTLFSAMVLFIAIFMHACATK